MGTIGIPASGGNGGKFQVIVHCDVGAEITMENSTVTKTFPNDNGVVMMSGLSAGLWTLRAYLQGKQRYRTVYITAGEECQIIYFHFNMVPDFSCTNMKFQIVDDADNILAGGIGTVGNWKIRFTEVVSGSYGTLIFNDLKGQYIDIFLVGGGGNGSTGSSAFWGTSGAGSGYTQTLKNFRAEEGVEYHIVVAGPGGNSSFVSANNAENPISIVAEHGGNPYEKPGGPAPYLADSYFAGDGGSGGGGMACREDDVPTEGGIGGPSGDGGSDGNNGGDGADGIWYYKDGYDYIQVLSSSFGGNGQGRTTREFEEPTGKMYAPGGAGGATTTSNCGYIGDGINGDNSGAGGSGTNRRGYSVTGKSGIVIIRNSRDQYGFV